ncbi:dethiobiotin synthase [Pontiella sulfatireligans]|uniref:ATP-dependent dethiobiotin synthetase BioD n=1 Tax=Pontiella sulfatireligans TaxID=2750658 RepID=A0A6C2UPR7_9BACT|nr:dethiobiotin synthase [Pontiella sulfatireligans]VGO22059.1 ATP-dependent dethiobiotin synthetase BioD 1 [Pontiella sulfatireligans]
MKGLFITGTDTDIGKTALSALLLAELRKRGINAAPMKPMQTGCKRKPETGNLKLEKEQADELQVSGFKFQVSPLSVPDLDYSLSMAQMEVSPETYQTMAPYQFEPACSPHLAAEMAGTEIDISEMVIAARTLASEYEFVIAEGAGGIIVPLNRRETMLDLMQALKLPIIIAARPGLGTINHTLLTIRTLRSDGLDILGVVFVASTPDEPGIIEDDNAATIEQFGKVPFLGTIPYCAQLQTAKLDYSALPLPLVASVEKIVNQLGI